MNTLSKMLINLSVYVAPLFFFALSARAQTPPPCAGLGSNIGAINRPVNVACDDSAEPFSAIGTIPTGFGQVIGFPLYTATLNGGVPRNFYGYSTRDNSICDSSNFVSEIYIEFSSTCTSASVLLFNRLPVPMTYTMTDSVGRTTKLALAAQGTYPEQGSLSLRGPGITSVRITPDSLTSIPNLRWYFTLPGVGWTPESSSCQCATVSPFSPHQASGHNWTMDVELSGNDGLVLRNVMLGPRYMAKAISIPYYVLQTSVLPLTRAELKPDSTDTTARSRLVDYHEDMDVEKLTIYATYSVDNIPAGSGSCLEITQRYEFYKDGTGCEPSDRLPCARFRPIVEYKFYGQNQELLTSINIVQRDYFQVDGKPGNSNAIFRDCESPFDPFPTCELSVIAFRRNPLLTEYIARVIDNGNDTGVWDNFHKTYLSIVKEPALLPIPTPGCEECVHIHWRWGRFAANPVFGGGLYLVIRLDARLSHEIQTRLWTSLFLIGTQTKSIQSTTRL